MDLGVERYDAPVVEDEKFHAGEASQQLWIAAIGAGQDEVLDKAGQPELEDGEVVATGLLQTCSYSRN